MANGVFQQWNRETSPIIVLLCGRVFAGAPEARKFRVKANLTQLAEVGMRRDILVQLRRPIVIVSRSVVSVNERSCPSQDSEESRSRKRVKRYWRAREQSVIGGEKTVPCS